MAATCAKPTCTQPAAAWFVTAPADCAVYLHEEPIDGGVALCRDHRARFTVPAGWSIHLEGRAVEHLPTGERRPWFASDVDDTPVTVAATPGSLLSRAFNGPADHPAVITPDELEARRFARLERVETDVDSTPERLRDRVEENGNDDRDGDGDGDQRTDRNVGSGENGPHDHHDEYQTERDDRAEPHGADELPFPPLESEATARAAIG